MYKHDQRIVLTLDAGGTNFVFSAIRECKEIVTPVCLPAASDNLDKCLSALLKGFSLVKDQLEDTPVAISFAFPGPADYKDGIIGDLPNFPAFRGGIALGPYLEEKFKIPVFINNDGNLFAYGEALAGALPAINEKLAAAGSPKRYKNLLGITLGTGFGIYPADGSDTYTFFCYQSGIFFIAHDPYVTTTSVVARQQAIVDNHSCTEPCSQSDSQ